MYRLLIAILVIIATPLSITPLLAQNADPAGASANSGDASADQEKRICRSESRPGSRLPAKPVCKTANEWAKSLRKSEDAAADFFDKKGTSYIEPPKGPK